MAAFEFGNYNSANSSRNNQETPVDGADIAAVGAGGKLRSEPIITLKIYDCCRSKVCLSAAELGPARDTTGAIIIPPPGSQSVTIENLSIGRINIRKDKNTFRPGYWDVDLRYTFSYDLVFYDTNGDIVDTIGAISGFAKKNSLFGSVGNEVFIATDLGGIETTAGDAPFVGIEAKVMPLSANIRQIVCENGATNPQVLVTMGLFSIVKLFRMASLVVESRGFVIPPECVDITPINPCDFFDELAFPIDSFSPPQRPEFVAGISANIPSVGINIPAGIDAEAPQA